MLSTEVAILDYYRTVWIILIRYISGRGAYHEYTFLGLGGTFIMSVCSSEPTDGDCDSAASLKVGCIGA